MTTKMKSVMASRPDAGATVTNKHAVDRLVRERRGRLGYPLRRPEDRAGGRAVVRGDAFVEVVAANRGIELIRQRELAVERRGSPRARADLVRLEPGVGVRRHADL